MAATAMISTHSRKPDAGFLDFSNTLLECGRVLGLQQVPVVRKQLFRLFERVSNQLCGGRLRRLFGFGLRGCGHGDAVFLSFSSLAIAPESRDLCLQHANKGFLRNVYLADLLHALFPLLLLFEELALSSDVTTVTFGGDILP